MLRYISFGALALAAQLAHADQAGKVVYVAGSASIAAKAAALDSPVNEGDLLSTSADGYVYIKTIDNGLFILRPNTRARVVSYRIDVRNPANTRIKLELISGVARSRSGDAVKAARQNFRFNTPVAAIGVRGTDFTVYTDQNISRVAVISGGITVSGFEGGCRPEGSGPCEGSTSRELSAAQRGQLLQVQRGEVVPQLMQGGTLAPDVVAPPKSNESVVREGAPTGMPVLAASEPSLAPEKQATLEKVTAATPLVPVVQPPVVTAPPVVVEPPPVVVVVEPPPVVVPPVVVVVEPPPVVVPPVVVPPLPPRDLIWGRWTSVSDKPAAIDLVKTGQDNQMVAMQKNYVLFRTPGEAYVTPAQGGIGFSLKDSEAYIYSDTAKSALAATIQNGQLSVDFGSKTFSTSFDLLGVNEVYKLQSQGAIGRDGTLYGESQFMRPTNMNVDGALSNANGGTAAYIFQSRLETNGKANGLIANGATYWGR